MIVKVVKYDPDWVNQFKKEALAIDKAIGNLLDGVYHIGSTSVPGLQAKPIIDIILAVKSLEDLDKQELKLVDLGYEAMGELGIKGRRYFRKGGDNRTHQIHAFQTLDPHIRRHLVFRNYLIEHPEIALEYGELKFDIAKKCKNDIEKYCDEKAAFVKHHEAEALKWEEALSEKKK